MHVCVAGDGAGARQTSGGTGQGGAAGRTEHVICSNVHHSDVNTLPSHRGVPGCDKRQQKGSKPRFKPSRSPGRGI